MQAGNCGSCAGLCCKRQRQVGLGDSCLSEESGVVSGPIWRSGPVFETRRRRWSGTSSLPRPMWSWPTTDWPANTDRVKNSSTSIRVALQCTCDCSAGSAIARCDPRTSCTSALIPSALLPRRSYLATFDDAFQDNAKPLRSHARTRPILFAPTAAMGGTATWAAGEPVLSWEELRTLEEAGVLIGSHARSHPRLSQLTNDDMADELEGSRHDLAGHLASPVAAVAYPHGDHDEVVVQKAHEAGFALGFVSLPGRNGAGTHPLCLRRIGIWAEDGPLRFAWKLITGEYAPGQARTEGLGLVTLVRQARRPDQSKGAPGES